MTLHDDLKFAHLLADAADAISTRFFSKGIGHQEKPDGTPVTEADRQIEDTLRSLVDDHRPEEGFLGEEYGASGPQQRRWIVDAIDGTVSFIAGDPGWGTLIALQVDGVVTVGVASSPPLGVRWWASTGGGAWTGSWPPSSESPQRLVVSSHSSKDTARVAVWPPPNQVSNKWQACAAAILKEFPVWQSSPPSLHLDAVDQPKSSQGPGFVNGALLVASGALDASVFFGGGPWDIATRALICEEAGGRYTDLWGGTRLDTRTAIVTNGLIHDQLIEIVSRSRPEAPRTP